MKRRVLLRWVVWCVAILLLLVGAALAMLHAYQDKIIKLFVAEANKHITTQVQVGDISISLFDKFPHASLSLRDVAIAEAVEGSTEPLARAKYLFCTFSLLDVLRGKYQVRQFFMEDGQVLVRVLPDGRANYHIYNTSDTTASEDFSFNLEKIMLQNVLVTYTDDQLKQTYKVQAQQLAASLGYEASLLRIATEGRAQIHTIKLGQSEYFKNKNVDLSTSITIDKPQQYIVVVPSVIKVNQAEYQVSGDIDYTNEVELDLALTGKNTSIQSLLSLLPETLTKEWSQYRSEGDVFFSGLVKGKVTDKESPLIEFSFGGKNAAFYHPDYKQKLEQVSFDGSFSNGEKHHVRTSVLELKNVKGNIKGRPFSGSILYKNFADPTVAVNIQADLDLAHVLDVFPAPQVKSGSGFVKVKLDFSGNLNKYRKSPGNNTIHTAGDVSLQNVSLQLAEYPLPVSNLSGNFMFRKNDMAVSDLKGRYGDSDFEINGLFRNMLAWLLLDNQKLLIEADLNSRFLNFDQLLSQNSNKNSSEAYYLQVSPLLAFDINADVEKLKFRRFNSRSLKGAVTLQNQVIKSPNVSFNAVGGRFSVRGNVDVRDQKYIKVHTTSRLENMRVDSLFYVFEDFGQSFLVQRHLRGDLTADITSDLYFDRYLNPKTDLMQAEVSALVRNGQLIHFEPMQKLSIFMKRSELANLQFSELSNKFWIQERTVFIPEMNVRTNLSRVSSLSFSGTHTFDQQMDYKFKVPFALAKRTTAEADDAGALYLTLKGNENDYKISYDKDRVATKIQEDIKKEKQELRNIFKGKEPEPEKQKEVQVNQDEYFNF
mgnify:CR=1 FL=1